MYLLHLFHLAHCLTCLPPLTLPILPPLPLFYTTSSFLLPSIFILFSPSSSSPSSFPSSSSSSFYFPLTFATPSLSCSQIAQGLEYLHSNQIVHLDMKSPNVLLWHFPSPRYSRSQRIQQSGNVWLKIADYGISQVSTGLSLRVDNAPVGTPGYMAPELFERAGQVISSDKVRHAVTVNILIYHM